MRFRMFLALAVFVVAPMGARQNGGSTTCYNCDNFSGSWSCSTASMFGGTSCTLGQNTCTVSGDCGASSSLGAVAVGNATLKQIVAVHPRLGATVFELTKTGQIDLTASVFWNADALSEQQALTLIQGGQVLLRPSPGRAVVFDSTFQVAGESAELVIIPRTDYPEDPVFIEFRMELIRENGVLVPRSWAIR